MRQYTTPFLLICLVFTTAGGWGAQDDRSLPLLPDSEVWIDGTSNKNDWTVHATEIFGALWLTSDGNSFSPDSVFFQAKSASLKSRKSSVMDRLMYKALNTTQYPDITFTLGSAGIENAESSGDTLAWNTTGMLVVAGVPDTVSTTVVGYAVDDGQYVFTGSHTMSMRDHDIVPPTALFGALHTGETITVNFNLVFGGESDATP